MSGWKLYRIDPPFNQLLRDDCTCGDHCKEIARKTRKTEFGYNDDMVFEIRNPVDIPWMKSVKKSGWRIKWEYI